MAHPTATTPLTVGDVFALALSFPNTRALLAEPATPEEFDQVASILGKQNISLGSYDEVVASSRSMEDYYVKMQPLWTLATLRNAAKSGKQYYPARYLAMYDQFRESALKDKSTDLSTLDRDVSRQVEWFYHYESTYGKDGPQLASKYGAIDRDWLSEQIPEQREKWEEYNRTNPYQRWSWDRWLSNWSDGLSRDRVERAVAVKTDVDTELLKRIAQIGADARMTTTKKDLEPFVKELRQALAELPPQSRETEALVKSALKQLPVEVKVPKQNWVDDLLVATREPVTLQDLPRPVRDSITRNVRARLGSFSERIEIEKAIDGSGFLLVLPQKKGPAFLLLDGKGCFPDA